MKTGPDPRTLDGDLRRLADRSYAEEGIPMLLVLENQGRLVTGIDGHGPDLGRILLAAASPSEEIGQARLARVIEWLADRTFGPSALEGERDG